MKPLGAFFGGGDGAELEPPPFEIKTNCLSAQFKIQSKSVYVTVTIDFSIQYG
jgi:hypothetical protein